MCFLVVDEERDDYQVFDVPLKLRCFRIDNLKLLKYSINVDLSMLENHKVVYFYYAIDKNNQVHIESNVSLKSKVRIYTKNLKEFQFERHIDGVIEFDKLMSNSRNFIARFMNNNDENKLITLKRNFLSSYLDQIDTLIYDNNNKINHVGLIRELHTIYDCLCSSEQIYEVSFKKVIVHN